MKAYRVGIIGCGGIARDHARAYGKIQNVKIIAGAEPDAGRREEFAKNFGLENSYEDYQEMLEKESLDIVSICTWPKAHCDAVCKAAEAEIGRASCRERV